MLKALQSGVDTYITKLFTPQELSQRLNRLEPPGRAAIQRIFSEIAHLKPKDTFPLVLIGEANANLSQIGHEDNRSTATFLFCNHDAVQRVDERMPDYKLGYTISDSTAI